MLRCDEKNLREYSVPNVCGVIITSNYKTDGSTCRPTTAATTSPGRRSPPATSSPDYFERLYRWFDEGGNRHVAAWLRAARPRRLQPEGAAAEDRGVLGDRRRRARLRGKRARRRHRRDERRRRAQGQQDQLVVFIMEKLKAAADEPLKTWLSDEEPAADPEAARARRLRPRQQPQRGRPPMEGRRQASDHLRAQVRVRERLARMPPEALRRGKTEIKGEEVSEDQ